MLFDEKGPKGTLHLTTMNGLDRESIFDFFRQHPQRPWHVQDIQKRLNIDDRAALNRLLGELTEEGRLIRTRRRTYGLPQEMNLFLGRLQVTSGGYGFVISDDEGEKDLFIPGDKLNGAWDGDRVVARPNTSEDNDGRISGEILRIIERKNNHLVGTLEYSRGYAILRPDSHRIKERILLTPDSVGKLEGGSRIVVRMIWPEESGEGEPFGEVEEYLGAEDSPEVETRAVIVKYGLKDEFDPKTLAEAAAVPLTITGEMMAGRTDYRQVNTFTIDGEDAKDFDDAISIERLDKGATGKIRVGVHIADVSYYVAEGTSLDDEALERATSVYLPGQVLPMLPEELSNGICSLIEGESRLALSVFIDMTREGKVSGVRFKETVVRSDARLTYEQVQEFVDGGRLPVGKRKLERDIKLLVGVTQKLREERLGAGALDFQFTEAKVDVDEDGELVLTPIRPNQARQLIEELMLLANRLVAKELDSKDIPALYRVHEDPSDEKIDALQKALAKLGYTLDLTKTEPGDLQEILRQASGKPEAQLVSTLLLRSLKQARYSADNLGHFGLAFENYLHFTSPIRRYPDLVVHRVVRALLQHRLSPTLKERMKSDFPKLAEHTSQMERLAEEAERDLTRYYHATWAKGHIGEKFNGVISGVTNFGIFVALPNGIEGLVHVSNLDDDYYVYIEDSLMLLGKHSRKKFRMGDRLDVRIFQANPTARQIDLIPASMEMPEVEAEDRTKRSKPPKNLKGPGREQPQAPARAGSSNGKDEAAAERAEAAEPAEDTKQAPKRGGRRGKRGKETQREQKPAPTRESRAQEKPAPKEAADRTGKAQVSEKPAKPKDVRNDEQPRRRRRRRRLVFGDS